MFDATGEAEGGWNKKSSELVAELILWEDVSCVGYIIGNECFIVQIY